MCGITGYVCFKDEVPERVTDMFTEMLVGIRSRGKDATGIAYLTTDSGGIVELCVDKEPVEAGEYIKKPGFISMLNAAPNVAIGHTRAATQGKPEDNNNNHPIISLDNTMALIHNGVIRNDGELFRKHSLPRVGEVDSEVIMRMLEKCESTDPKKMVAEAMPSISGSYAVALLDLTRPNKLWLYRHNNPIVLGWWDEGKTLFFASEDKHIKNAWRNCTGIEEARVGQESGLLKSLFASIPTVQLSSDIVFEIDRGRQDIDASEFETYTWTPPQGRGGLWNYGASEGYYAGTAWNSGKPKTTPTKKGSTTKSQYATAFNCHYVCATCNTEAMLPSDSYSFRLGMSCLNSGCMYEMRLVKISTKGVK
jgi:asparagine synthetase B (glutamine-hydrolysing)